MSMGCASSSVAPEPGPGLISTTHISPVAVHPEPDHLAAARKPEAESDDELPGRTFAWLVLVPAAICDIL